MPRPVFDTKDTIPKGFEDEYEEKDGKWHPKEDAGIATLRDTLDKERKRAEAAEALAKKAAADLKKKEIDDKAGKDGITSEKLAEIRADVRKEIEAEFAPKLAKAESDAKENRSLKLDNQVKKLAGELGFLGDRLDQYWKLHGDEFDLTDDGKVMVKANPGMTPAKLIESHKAKLTDWVQGTKGEGGGAAGQQRGGGQATTPSLEAVLSNPSAALAAARASGKTE